MSVRIRVAEAGRIDPSVNLCGRDRGVAEQLLDRAQVGTALQEMRGEAVTQRVRRDSGRQRSFANPEPEPPGDVGVGEAPAALGEEEGLLARVRGQGVAATLAVAAQSLLRRLAHRQEPFL